MVARYTTHLGRTRVRGVSTVRLVEQCSSGSALVCYSPPCLPSVHGGGVCAIRVSVRGRLRLLRTLGRDGSGVVLSKCSGRFCGYRLTS